MENKVKLEKVGFLIADHEIIPYITNTRETKIKSLVTEEIAPINLINGDKTCASDYQNNFVQKLLDAQSIRVIDNYVSLIYGLEPEIDIISCISIKDCLSDKITADIVNMEKCSTSSKKLDKKHKLDNTKYTYGQYAHFVKMISKLLESLAKKQQKNSLAIHKAIQKSLDRKEKNQFEF